MKKGLCFAIFTVFCFTAYPITQEELEQAQVTLKQMQKEIRVMFQAVNFASRLKFLDLDLTAEQLQALKDRYTTKKAILQGLYQELP